MKLRNLLIYIFTILFLIQNIYSIDGNQGKVEVILFYGDGCPHCHNAIAELSIMKENNNNFVLKKYEIYSNTSNRDILKKYTTAYNVELRGVPTFFISDNFLTGFDKEKISNLISKCELEGCKDSSEIVEDYYINLNNKNNNNNNDNDGSDDKNDDGNGGKNNLNKNFKSLSILAVILAALVDAINPCAFAVLILLLTTVLSTKNRKKSLYCGLSFILAIFLSYLFMGFGLYSAISSIKISKIIYILIGLFSIILGLFNLKDYFFYGKWFITEVPLKWRPKLKKIISKVISVRGAFFTGFLVSLFLLPCTSGPYIVILTMLSNSTTKFYASLLLVLYNLIFVLPMFLITFGVYYGLMDVTKMEKHRLKNLKNLHLIAGVVLILLGIFIFNFF